MMFSPWKNQKCCFIGCDTGLIKIVFGSPCVFKTTIILVGARFAFKCHVANVTKELFSNDCGYMLEKT